jgi:hypothetical protein
MNSVYLRLGQSQSVRGRIDRAFEPIGVVLQFHLAFELCGQVPFDQPGAEASAAGRRNGRPIPLAPMQPKLLTSWIGCQGPGDFDVSFVVR